MILDRKKKYLQIALNSTLQDAEDIIDSLPSSERIIIEAGTPLVKEFGMEAIRRIRRSWENRLYGMNILPYVVADLKTMDRGEREVRMVKDAGASGAICLGQAPVETIESFIDHCRRMNIDSMVDMMNVDQPIKVLRKLKRKPDVVLLHRGVDEEAFNPDKPIPYIQINKVRSSFDVFISIAGGDTIREVQRAIFNDANIVVVWKEFYQATGQTGELAKQFLETIR